MKSFLKFWLMALGLIILGFALATAVKYIIIFIYFLPNPAYYIVMGFLSVTAFAGLLSMFNDYLKSKYPIKEN